MGKAKRLLALLFALTMLLTACSNSNNGSGTTPTGSTGTETQASDGGNSGDSGDSGESSGDNVLRASFVFEDMDSLDGHKYTTTDVLLPGSTIVEPLLQINAEGEVEPLLLEALPEMSEDGTLFTCKIKPGIKFHNGTELTSADVEFTLNRIFDPATQNVNTWLCDMILGGTDMLEGKADTLTGFKVIDDYTFTIELDKPFAPFYTVLTCPQMAILPKDACEEAGDQWGVTTYVGTGPFVFEAFEAKDYLHVKKNADYHGEPVKLDELYIYNKDQNTAAMEFEAGNLDLVWLEPDVAATYQQGDFAQNLVTIDLMGIISLNLNVNMAPLDNVKVREAISYAIDRDALVSGFLQGNARATACLIPPGISGYENRPTDTYDPEKAKELLAEAGFPDGISLEAHVDESRDTSDIAVVLQEQMKAANINLTVTKVDRAGYIDMRTAGEVQTPFLTWYKDYPDPDNFIYTFFHSTSSAAFSSNWNDTKTDEMLTEGRQAEGSERESIYSDLEKYLVTEQFITVPLYNPVFYYLISDRTQGLLYDDAMIYFHEATVN